MTTLVDLVALHKAQLGDAVKPFTAGDDADFVRHLQSGARRLIDKRPVLKRDSLTLVTGCSVYLAAADLVKFSRYEWGRGAIQQFRIWDPDWPGPFPEVQEVITDDGPELVFWPAPTLQQITLLGAEFPYWYYALHTVSDNLVTVLPEDQPMLLLAALIEAVRELTTRGVVAPVQLHRGVVPTATSQTPLAWFQELQREWSLLQ